MDPVAVSYLMGPGPHTPLGKVIDAIAEAGCAIADAVSSSRLHGLHDRTNAANASGDNQTSLDVLANRVMLSKLAATGEVAVMVSEEEREPVLGAPNGRLAVAFDPLDGSSNIEAGLTVGTLFAVFETDPTDRTRVDNLLQHGHKICAAGYLMYGAQTLLVAATSLAGPVHSFARPMGSGSGKFLPAGLIAIPARPKRVLSVNVGNASRWTNPATVAFVQAALESDSFSLRYVGSMVADLHRTLVLGGLFMYPADRTHRHGKLRLLYECFPAAFLVEAAGGAALSEQQRLLDIKPTDPHQRTPITFGSNGFVSEVAGLGVAHSNDMTRLALAGGPRLELDGQSPGHTRLPASGPLRHVGLGGSSGDMQESAAPAGPSATVAAHRSRLAFDAGGGPNAVAAVATPGFEGNPEHGELSVAPGELVFGLQPLADRRWIRVAKVGDLERGVIPTAVLDPRPVTVATTRATDLARCSVAVATIVAPGFDGNPEQGELTVGPGELLVGLEPLADPRWVRATKLVSLERGAVPRSVIDPHPVWISTPGPASVQASAVMAALAPVAEPTISATKHERLDDGFCESSAELIYN